MQWSHTHVELASAPEHVGAEYAIALGVVNNRFKSTNRFGVFRAHRNERFARANSERGGCEPFNDRLRVLFEEESIRKHRRI